jgi:hypothetical protein
LLDRNNNTPDIISYKVVSQYPSSSGNSGGDKRERVRDANVIELATLCTDDECLSTARSAPEGQCVEAADVTPFVKAFLSVRSRE